MKRVENEKKTPERMNKPRRGDRFYTKETSITVVLDARGNEKFPAKEVVRKLPSKSRDALET